MARLGDEARQALAEPELELADKAAKLATRGKCDLVVGFGGGSAMDLAKAVAALVPNKAQAVDFLGLNKVLGPGLPTIMVPTTAGTGSEATAPPLPVAPRSRNGFPA